MTPTARAAPRALISIAAAASICTLAAAAEIPQGERKSGFEFMSRETQAMQRDDTLNPGMLWVLDGAARWSRKDGGANRSCADCHGEAATSMRGVAARYPAYRREGGARDRPRRAASMPAASAIRMRRRSHPKRRSCSAWSRTSPTSRAAWRSPPTMTSAWRRFASMAGFCSTSGLVSCISPARNAMTGCGASGLAAAPFRRRIRPAIRSIGWSGSRSDRCSAGCATA